MKLLKKEIQDIDANGMIAGSNITLLLYYSTDSAYWKFIRRNIRVVVAKPVTWQVKRMLKGQIDTPL